MIYERTFFHILSTMPPLDTATQRGEATRQSILDSAERLFLAQGYNGTSMRQIADQAGAIAVSGIYNHFANKKDIFEALLEKRSPYPELIHLLDAIQDGGGPAMLEQMFTGVHELMITHFGFVRLVLIDLQEFEGDTIIGLVSEVLPHALAFFTRMQEAGEIRQDVSIFALARAVVSMLIGFALTDAFMFQDQKPRLPLFPEMERSQWQEAILNILLNGLIARQDAV